MLLTLDDYNLKCACGVNELASEPSRYPFVLCLYLGVLCYIRNPAGMSVSFGIRARLSMGMHDRAPDPYTGQLALDGFN